MTATPTDLPSPLDRHHAARLLLAWGQGPIRRMLAGLPDRPGAASSLDEITDATGLTPRETATVVGKAVDLGLLTRDAEGRFAIDTDGLQRLAESLVGDSPLAAVLAAHPRLRPFVTAGRFSGWPSRPELIEECYVAVAEALPGGVWRESELNDWFGLFTDDGAGLRRGLVDRGLMLRAPGSDELRVAQTG